MDVSDLITIGKCAKWASLSILAPFSFLYELFFLPAKSILFFFFPHRFSILHYFLSNISKTPSFPYPLDLPTISSKHHSNHWHSSVPLRPFHLFRNYGLKSTTSNLLRSLPLLPYFYLFLGLTTSPSLPLLVILPALSSS